MPKEENIKLVNRYMEEVWKKGNLDAVDRLLAEDYEHLTPPPGMPPNREGFKAFAGMMRNAFPDLDFSIHETVADGDQVSQRWQAEGTHRGELMGVPPTGNTCTIEGISMYKIEDGRISKDATVSDMLRLMQQIGAVSMPTP